MYCKNGSYLGGSLILYVKENMICRKLIAEQFDSNLKISFLEVTLKTQKMVNIWSLQATKVKRDFNSTTTNKHLD